MTEQSVYARIRRIELAIGGILSGVDQSELDPPARKVVGELKRNIIDARLDVRSYEYAETRSEQLGEAESAKKRLHRVRDDILAASQHSLVGPIDVAELSARIDELLAALD